MGAAEMNGFMVNVTFTDDHGNEKTVFGPYEVVAEAEECVTVLAARSDVLSATIELEEGEDDE